VTKPANDKPNVVPANVANIVAEFQRLAAAGDDDARIAKDTPASSALVIRGK
jgi:DNA-directed RNA polymerase